MRLDASIADIEQCRSLDSLRALMHGIAQDYGFVSYIFLDISDPGATRPLQLATINRDWEDTYRSNQFSDVDPCISNARRTNIPFTWAQFSNLPYAGRRKPGAIKLYEAAADFNYTQGFVVPFHFHDALGRACSSLVTFIWSDPSEKFDFMMSERRHDLHLITLYWAQRVSELALTEQHGSSAAFRAPESLDRHVLTDRERAVLAWAARGKTVSETADILKISENTVETYFKSVHEKLNVTNKTHAVVKAIYNYLIDV